mmetsp:Transcript_49221/g.124952  ORF Transcript_49221/g.124952 Transcript_49221/m.124952 type:complete len:209 (+) Transcript_49221:74-700(+)
MGATACSGHCGVQCPGGSGNPAREGASVDAQSAKVGFTEEIAVFDEPSFPTLLRGGNTNPDIKKVENLQDGNLAPLQVPSEHLPLKAPAASSLADRRGPLWEKTGLDFSPKLFKVEKLKDGTLSPLEVPMKRCSLQGAECFVLDAGDELFFFSGPMASMAKRSSAQELASSLVRSRGEGNVSLSRVDGPSSAFWTYLDADMPLSWRAI